MILRQERILRNNPNSLDIDVAGDGACLFYSIVFSILIPALKEQQEFEKRYTALFGKANPAVIENTRQLLNSYDGSKNFILSDKATTLRRAINHTFRNRIVSHMMEHKESGVLGNKDRHYQDFVDEPVEGVSQNNNIGITFATQMQAMRQPFQYASEREIAAAVDMLAPLGIDIVVHTFKPNDEEVVHSYQICSQPKRLTIHLIHDLNSHESKSANHYRYFLDSGFLNHSYKKSSETNETPQKTNSNTTKPSLSNMKEATISPAEIQSRKILGDTIKATLQQFRGECEKEKITTISNKIDTLLNAATSYCSPFSSTQISREKLLSQFQEQLDYFEKNSTSEKILDFIGFEFLDKIHTYKTPMKFIVLLKIIINAIKNDNPKLIYMPGTPQKSPASSQSGETMTLNKPKTELKPLTIPGLSHTNYDIITQKELDARRTILENKKALLAINNLPSTVTDSINIIICDCHYNISHKEILISLAKIEGSLNELPNHINDQSNYIKLNNAIRNIKTAIQENKAFTDDIYSINQIAESIKKEEQIDRRNFAQINPFLRFSDNETAVTLVENITAKSSITESAVSLLSPYKPESYLPITGIGETCKAISLNLLWPQKGTESTHDILEGSRRTYSASLVASEREPIRQRYLAVATSVFVDVTDYIKARKAKSSLFFPWRSWIDKGREAQINKLFNILSQFIDRKGNIHTQQLEDCFTAILKEITAEFWFRSPESSKLYQIINKANNDIKQIKDDQTNEIYANHKDKNPNINDIEKAEQKNQLDSIRKSVVTEYNAGLNAAAKIGTRYTTLEIPVDAIYKNAAIKRTAGQSIVKTSVDADKEEIQKKINRADDSIKKTRFINDATLRHDMTKTLISHLDESDLIAFTNIMQTNLVDSLYGLLNENDFLAAQENSSNSAITCKKAIEEVIVNKLEDLIEDLVLSDLRLTSNDDILCDPRIDDCSYRKEIFQLARAAKKINEFPFIKKLPDDSIVKSTINNILELRSNEILVKICDSLLRNQSLHESDFETYHAMIAHLTDPVYILKIKQGNTEIHYPTGNSELRSNGISESDKEKREYRDLLNSVRNKIQEVHKHYQKLLLESTSMELFESHLFQMTENHRKNIKKTSYAENHSAPESNTINSYIETQFANSNEFIDVRNRHIYLLLSRGQSAVEYSTEKSVEEIENTIKKYSANASDIMYVFNDALNDLFMFNNYDYLSFIGEENTINDEAQRKRTKDLSACSHPFSYSCNIKNKASIQAVVNKVNILLSFQSKYYNERFINKKEIEIFLGSYFSFLIRTGDTTLVGNEIIKLKEKGFDSIINNLQLTIALDPWINSLILNNQYDQLNKIISLNDNVPVGYDRIKCLSSICKILINNQGNISKEMYAALASQPDFIQFISDNPQKINLELLHDLYGHAKNETKSILFGLVLNNLNDRLNEDAHQNPDKFFNSFEWVLDEDYQNFSQKTNSQAWDKLFDKLHYDYIHEDLRHQQANIKNQLDFITQVYCSDICKSKYETTIESNENIEEFYNKLTPEFLSLKDHQLDDLLVTLKQDAIHCDDFYRNLLCKYLKLSLETEFNKYNDLCHNYMKLHTDSHDSNISDSLKSKYDEAGIRQLVNLIKIYLTLKSTGIDIPSADGLIELIKETTRNDIIPQIYNGSVFFSGSNKADNIHNLNETKRKICEHYLLVNCVVFKICHKESLEIDTGLNCVRSAYIAHGAAGLSVANETDKFRYDSLEQFSSFSDLFPSSFMGYHTFTTNSRNTKYNSDFRKACRKEYANEPIMIRVLKSYYSLLQAIKYDAAQNNNSETQKAYQLCLDQLNSILFLLTNVNETLPIDLYKNLRLSIESFSSKKNTNTFINQFANRIDILLTQLDFGYQACVLSSKENVKPELTYTHMDKQYYILNMLTQDQSSMTSSQRMKLAHAELICLIEVNAQFKPEILHAIGKSIGILYTCDDAAEIASYLSSYIGDEKNIEATLQRIQSMQNPLDLFIGLRTDLIEYLKQQSRIKTKDVTDISNTYIDVLDCLELNTAYEQSLHSFNYINIESLPNNMIRDLTKYAETYKDSKNVHLKYMISVLLYTHLTKMIDTQKNPGINTLQFSLITVLNIMELLNLIDNQLSYIKIAGTQSTKFVTLLQDYRDTCEKELNKLAGLELGHFNPFKNTINCITLNAEISSILQLTKLISVNLANDEDLIVKMQKNTQFIQSFKQCLSLEWKHLTPQLQHFLIGMNIRLFKGLSTDDGRHIIALLKNTFFAKYQSETQMRVLAAIDRKLFINILVNIYEADKHADLARAILPITPNDIDTILFHNEATLGAKLHMLAAISRKYFFQELPAIKAEDSPIVCIAVVKSLIKTKPLEEFEFKALIKNILNNSNVVTLFGLIASLESGINREFFFNLSSHIKNAEELTAFRQGAQQYAPFTQAELDAIKNISSLIQPDMNSLDAFTGQPDKVRNIGM